MPNIINVLVCEWKQIPPTRFDNYLKSLKPERTGDDADASGFITNVSKASFNRTANFT